MRSNEERVMNMRIDFDLDGSDVIAVAILELADALKYVAYGTNSHPGALEVMGMALGYKKNDYDYPSNLAEAILGAADKIAEGLERNEI